MKLSNNYSLWEFERSNKASAIGHSNKVPQKLIPSTKALTVNVLQPINDHTGWKNDISSGFRDLLINKLVGGSVTSQHPKGEASDNNFFYRDENGIKVYIKPIEVAKVVIELDLLFDQMILYNNFIHLSHVIESSDKKSRKQILYNKSYNGERL